MASRTNKDSVQLSLTIDGKQAEDTIKTLDKQGEKIVRQLMDLEEQGKETTDEYKKLKEEQQDLLRQSNELYSKMKAASEQQQRLAVNEGKSMNQLQREYRQLSAIVKNLSPEHKDFNDQVDLLHRKKAKIDEMRSKFAGVKKEVKETGGFLGKLRDMFAPAALVAGIVSVARGIVNLRDKAIELFDVQAKSDAQLKAVLKSTGQVAGRSFEALKAQAAGLQEVTLFGDEATQQSQALLLTFTNVRDEVFDKTVPLIQDYATAMATASGESVNLKDASIQIGKALNDPIKGISALSRAGVQFTDDQKEMIKSLVEGGKMADAQRVILKELEKQFGGSARAAAEAGAGPITQLTNKFNDLLEIGGQLIVRFLGPFIGMANKVVDWLSKMALTLSDMTDTTMGTVGATIKLQQEFNNEIETLQRGNLSAENRKKLIGDINSKYAEYLPNLIKETDSLEDLKVAQDAVNTALLERIKIMAAQRAFAEIQEQLIRNQVEALNLQIELTAAQNRFNTAAEKGNSIAFKNDSLQRAAVGALGDLRDAEEAVKENIRQQGLLEAQLNRVKAAAESAGIALIDPPSPGKNGNGSGNGNGNNKKAEAEKETQREITEIQRIGQIEQIQQVEFTEAEKKRIRDEGAAHASELIRSEMEHTARIEEYKRQQAEETAKKKEAMEKVAIDAANDGFNTTIALLSADENARKKNAKAIKGFQVGQVFTNLFEEISGIWKTANSSPLNILFPGAGTGIAVAKSAFATARAQLAISNIQKQKFEKGAVVKGASHNQGGIKLFDTVSQQVVGEMEGGEPYLILSKNTYRNNKRVVDSLLYNSMYRGGAPIFANGGLFQPQVIQSQNNLGQSTQRSEELQMALLTEQRQMRQAIEAIPTTLQASVSIQTIEDASETLGDIRKAASL